MARVIQGVVVARLILLLFTGALAAFSGYALAGNPLVLHPGKVYAGRAALPGFFEVTPLYRSHTENFRRSPKFDISLAALLRLTDLKLPAYHIRPCLDKSGVLCSLRALILVFPFHSFW